MPLIHRLRLPAAVLLALALAAPAPAQQPDDPPGEAPSGLPTDGEPLDLSTPEPDGGAYPGLM